MSTGVGGGGGGKGGVRLKMLRGRYNTKRLRGDIEVDTAADCGPLECPLL